MRAANSLGFVELPNTGLNNSGYKGVWFEYKVLVPFLENENYVFDVDEESKFIQTCEVIVYGETARVKKTKNQNYFGEIINGILVLNEGN